MLFLFHQGERKKLKSFSSFFFLPQKRNKNPPRKPTPIFVLRKCHRYLATKITVRSFRGQPTHFSVQYFICTSVLFAIATTIFF